MDELTRRREARRRKILENSENRLSRITGIERKTTVSCNNTADGPIEVEGCAPLNHQPLHHGDEVHRVPPTADPTPQRSKLPQKPVRTIVIIALAVFVNLLILVLEKRFMIKLNATHLNKIFMPLLAYDIIDLTFNNKTRTDDYGFVWTLLLANPRYVPIKPFLKYLQLISIIIQDVMVYFFVFVCCNAIKTNVSSLQ